VNVECTAWWIPAACVGKDLLQQCTAAIAMSTVSIMAAAAHMWLEAVRPACNTTCCHQQGHCFLLKFLEIGWHMDDWWVDDEHCSVTTGLGDWTGHAGTTSRCCCCYCRMAFMNAAQACLTIMKACKIYEQLRPGQPCGYNTWLLIESTPKGIVFSFLF
jgi:hypothetical protein